MAFLKEHQLRPWQLQQAGEFQPIGLALGPGHGGLEVAIAESHGTPSMSALRSAWKARQAGRPAPVLLVVLYDGKAALCGPAGDQPPAFLDLTPERVETICATALAEPDRHAALRFLQAIIPEAETP